uniref:Ig-like domain-containing protein n=1 Tax=Chelonoidis abingdonii TaxID=106734 RepID=A0A8C0GWG8_CHEAB
MLLLYLSVPNTFTLCQYSVTQTEGSVITSQGDLVRLNCTYQFSLAANVDPFWYVQFPSQPPMLFLRDLGREDSDEGIRKGFNATHDKKDKSFHLWKPSSDLSDSGTYYCAARDTVTLTGRGTAQKPCRGCAEQQGGGHWVWGRLGGRTWHRNHTCFSSLFLSLP